MGAFYRTGSIPAEDGILSYEDMAYAKFNAVSSKRWVQTAIRQDWAECNVLDKLHEQFNWYNFGMDNPSSESMVENSSQQ